MYIRELMTLNPETCVPMDTCATAGAIMRRRNCGFVPVVESRTTHRVVGVITDRDIAMALVEADRSPTQLLVESVMTKAPVVVTPEADLEEAAKLMETRAVHRLPVVEDGRLIGVLSLNDIAVVARKQWACSGPHVAERQMTEILEAVAAAQMVHRD